MRLRNTDFREHSESCTADFPSVITYIKERSEANKEGGAINDEEDIHHGVRNVRIGRGKK